MDLLIQDTSNVKDIEKKIELITLEIHKCEMKMTKLLEDKSGDIVENIIIFNEFFNDFNQLKNIFYTLQHDLKKIDTFAKNNMFILKEIIKIKNYMLLKEKLMYVHFVYNLYDELSILFKSESTTKNKLRIIEIISQLETYFKENKLICLRIIYEKYTNLLKTYKFIPKK